MKQPVFLYSPGTGTLERQSDTSTPTSGWLIDFERVVSGAKQVIYFKADGRSFIALDRDLFEIGVNNATVSHSRGAFLSTLKVVDVQGREHVVKYLTPWWRLFFDDGSHPDLQFPLGAFADQYGRLEQKEGTTAN